MSSAGSLSTIAPQSFKGIAVFTPGGDLVYCRDPQKQAQWHLNLCAALQEHLGLVESPHFLVPSFTATVDCWVDETTQTQQVVAEAYPLVHRYQGLLNALFALDAIEWKQLTPRQEHRSLSVLHTYAARFPQLWENHQLVLDISPQAAASTDAEPSQLTQTSTQGPVLRLFVSGHSALTEQILKTLQEVLESSRYRPYTLQMIDVSKHPEQAEADQISATPTLIRIWPQPTRRLVGELDNPRAILSLLSDSQG
ncbi:MAG: circadian clock KaiB family protein [Cyanobacteria bacterium J06626_18]